MLHCPTQDIQSILLVNSGTLQPSIKRLLPNGTISIYSVQHRTIYSSVHGGTSRCVGALVINTELATIV